MGDVIQLNPPQIDPDERVFHKVLAQVAATGVAYVRYSWTGERIEAQLIPDPFRSEPAGG